ncbi:MAG: hypothetical protein Q7S58_08535 [Candidatus Binatus sp.]|uniref:hypothetical protein n=1 Tax=Candidatus Binatus sp. TaxID=2811406 RepID=UPI0027220DAA|nr:hypothetical protein [Candidatus Binatus sp.]MDO8432439.1 hypothetical protein [Candidatus Binatus sp.]
MEQERFPELHGAIAAFREAIARRDTSVAEKFVAAAASTLEAYRQAAAEIAKLPDPIAVEALGLARIGGHFISKLKIESGARTLKFLYRWRREPDGRWLIVAVEDISNKRSSWSDVPDLKTAAAQVRAENGNA